MRIKQLRLTRYGHFTDFNIDFGEPCKKGTDLHLVYGANEAGKSTTLSAIVDLLYGIQPRSRYKFLHDYQTMEVGALLEQNGDTSEYRRFRTKLTDQFNQPLSDNAIDTHGLNREDFQSRFSFDETTLKEGGEAILDNNGDLGAALFSATSGISDFTATLNRQMESANQFYEPGKKKGKSLFDIKTELAEIDAKRKSLDVNASHWSKQEQLAAEHKNRYEEFNTLAQERKMRLDGLKRQLQALEIQQRYLNQKAMADAQPAMPTVPSSWFGTAKELIKQQSFEQAQLQQLDTQQASIKTQINQLQVDEVLLTHVQSIDSLRAQRTLWVQREQDLTTLQREQAELLEKQTRLRNKMDMPQASEAANKSAKKDKHELLSQTQISELRAHITEHSELKTALEIARKEHQAITDELAQLPFSEPEEPVSTEVLENYLALVQDQATHVWLKQLQTQLTELESEQAAKLSDLNPWQGSSDELLELPVPSKQHLSDLQKTKHELSNAINMSQSHLAQLDADLKALNLNAANEQTDSKKTSLITERLERDKAWQQHLELLDGQAAFNQLQKSARDYSVKQRLLDNTTDAEILDAVEQGSRDATQGRYAQLQEQVQGETQHLATLQEQLLTADAQLKKATQAVALPKEFSAGELISWLDERQSAIEIIHRKTKLQSELESVSTDLTAEMQRLKQLIVSIDNTASQQLDSMRTPAEIIALALSCLRRTQQTNTELAQQREQYASLNSRNTFRKTQLEKSEQAFKNWNKQWQKLLEPTWISETDTHYVANVLDEAQELLSLQERINEKQERINSLNALQESFEENAQSLLTNLSRKNDASLTQQLDTLFVDAAKAVEGKSAMVRLQDRDIELQAGVEKLQSSLSPINKQLKTMLSKCAVNDVTQLETTLEKIKELTSQLEKLTEYEQDLMSVLRSDSINAALDQLEGLDEQTLASHISEIEIDVKQDDDRLIELHHEYRSVQDQLDTFNSDATVARLNQARQNLLLDLEAQAMQTMRARLGKLAIEQGVRHFREQHRSSMLENAKRAFVTITCGNYVDLSTQPGKKSNSEDLVGIKASGQSTLAGDMSTGTRAQLYLALRIAAYQDYCKTRSPLPFVADDIMESFDEERTEATLSLLSGMARQGQIIYLTHHRHVVDIAKQMLGDEARVHDLPRRVDSTLEAKQDQGELFAEETRAENTEYGEPA